MNRFSSRVISLILAVAFLFSAAAISFGSLFHGVTAFAADANDPKIISVTADGQDMFTKVVADTLIRNLEIVIEAPVDVTKATFKFDGSNFAASTSDTPKITQSTESGKTNNYTISLANVTYTAGKNTISFSLTENSKTYNASHTIKLATVSDGYAIKSTSYFDSNGIPLSSVTGGSTITFMVAIEDGALSKADLEVCPKVNIRINRDSFEPSTAKPAQIKNITALANGGVSYDIVFADLRYTGKSNTLQLFVDYGDNTIPERRFSYEVPRFIVNEVSSRPSHNKDDDDESSSSHPDIAPPTPTLIVSSFDYGGNNVTAAGNFTLKMVVKNTSKKLPIDNIVVKVTVPEAFTMNGSSNTFYIEKMPKDSSQELSLDLSVKPNAEPISHPIKIAFSFESVISEARKALTADQEISIPVGQLDRFTLNSVEVPREIYVGEDSSFEVTFVNKGKTPVYNVSAEISGNITQPGQLQFIGNLESGKENSADFLLGAAEGGVITGEVLISYEDANMHVTELRTPFTCTAIQMEMNGGASMEVQPTDVPPEALPWYSVLKTVPVWGWIGGGVALIIFICFGVKMVRMHRAKKQEEQDEDF